MKALKEKCQTSAKIFGLLFFLISFLDYKFNLILWKYQPIVDYYKKIRPFSTNNLSAITRLLK